MAELDTVQQEGLTRLVLRGELDLADYPQLSAELHRLEAPGPRVMAIDLREVNYIDSTGLRWLVEAHQRARSAGRRLLVIHVAGEAVERIFRLCRLDEVLDLLEDATPVGG